MNLKSLRLSQLSQRRLLAGGLVLVTLGLITDLYGLPSLDSRSSNCTQIVQAKTALTREQLMQFLALPKGAKSSQILSLINAPYCKLAGVTSATGGMVDRQAYPLTFDPQTWMVVKYEGEQYVGYEFKIR